VGAVKVFAPFGRPEFLRAFHGWSVVAWFGLWGVASVFGWIQDVRFVSHISMAALVLGSWSSWQAARVEVRQEDQIEEVTDPAATTTEGS
jgi:hypothetical protein